MKKNNSKCEVSVGYNLLQHKTPKTSPKPNKKNVYYKSLLQYYTLQPLTLTSINHK